MFALFQTEVTIGTAFSEEIATSLSDNLGLSTVFQRLAISKILVIPLLILFFKLFKTPKVRT